MSRRNFVQVFAFATVTTFSLLCTAYVARAANQIWDPNQIGTGSDGTGNWDTTTSLWSNGTTDAVWTNGNVAVFGVGGTAGTVTLTTPIQANGLTFNSGVTGNYTIAASDALETLTLNGTTPTITVNGGSPTISAIIAGTAGMTTAGTGTLIVSGANTYTGTTTISSGTLQVNSGGTLGAVANGLVLGTASTSTGTTNTATGALTLNANATIGTFSCSTFNTAANTIAINGSSVLTINGASNIGLVTSVAAPVPTTVLNVTGNELDLNNTITIGQADTAASIRSVTNVDMSGLATFKMIATGSGQAFNQGTAAQAGGTVILANTSNTITTNTISVSNTTSNAGTCTLRLGGGTNTLNATTITVGAGKGTGTINFAGNNGSVTIAGLTGGASTANITIGNGTSATSGGTSTVALAGHLATVQAGTVIIGQLANATGGTPIGLLTFDTGTFTATNIQIANNTGGSAANGANGTLTIGGASPNNTATGIFNATNFSLANATNTNATSTPTKGNFVMNGATANIGSDITATKAATSTATLTTTLTLAGGTLNMNGHTIGPVAATTQAIGTLTLPAIGQTATISNLGGSGINASAGTGASSGGVSMAGAGTLVLSGANTYTGNTTVGSGTLLVNGTLTASTPTVGGGTLGGTGTISNLVTVNNGNLTGGSGTTPTGTLTLSNGLTLNSGNLLFDIGTGTSGSINVTGGAVTFNSASLAFVLGGAPTPGSVFHVLTTTSPLSAGGLNLATQSVGRTTFTPAISGNDLIVTTGGGPATLIWRGDNVAGAIWDSGAGSTQNWNNTTQAINPDVFYDADTVTFDNTGNKNVTLNTTVSPGSLTFSNTSGAPNAYTISGGGTIAGTTGLAVTGGGTVTISTINSFTGNTTISGGSTLSVSSLAVGGTNSSIGAATTSIVLDGSTLQWTGNTTQTTDRGITITQNGATLDASPTVAGQGITIGGLVKLTGSGARTLTLTGIDASLGTQAISGVIADGTGGATNIVKTGSNSWQLSAANTFTGGTAINAGRIRATNGAAFGASSSAVTVANGAQAYLNTGAVFANSFSITGIGVLEANGNNGALRLGSNNANVSGTVTLAGDARITARGTTTGGTSTISGQITGSHNLELGNGGSVGVMTLSNATNNWNGSTTISLGTVKAGANSTSTAGVIPHGSGFGDVTINGITQDANNVGGSTLDANGFNLIVNGLKSSGDLTQVFVTNNSTNPGTITFGDNNATASFDGAFIAGTIASVAPLNITKIGNGVQTLSSASNSYTGSTNVNAGTLALASTASIASSQTINVAAPGTLDITAFGSSGFNVGASSAQTLVNNGIVAGTTSVGSIGIATGTGNYGPVVLSGGIFTPGTATTVGTVAATSLTAGSGSLKLKFSGATADRVNLSGSTDISNSAITIAPLSLVTPGHYITLTSGSALTNITPGLLATFGRATYTIDSAPLASHQLQITVAGGPAALKWTGADNATNPSNWDNSQSNANWIRTDSGGGDTTHYYDLDNVTFDGTNVGPSSLTISGNVSPGSVSVTAGNYTFDGGAIVGAANLTISGTGKLTLNATNNYTGGTTLNQGTLNLGNAAALGAGTLTLNGGTLDNTTGSALTISPAIPVVWGGNFTVTGAADTTHDINTGTGLVSLNGSAPTVSVAAGTFTAGGVVANGTGNTLTKTGAGTLVLNVPNTYTGATTVSAGTLRLGPGTSATTGGTLGTTAGQTFVNGGTLDVDGQNLAAEVVNIQGSGAGGVGALINNGADNTNALQNVVLTGDATIGGTNRFDIRGGVATLSTGGQHYKLTKVGTNQFSLVGATVDATLGDIDIQGGSFAVQTTTNGIGDPNNTLTIGPLGTLNLFRFGQGSPVTTATPLDKKIVSNGGTVFIENDPGNVIGNPTTPQSFTLNATTTFNVNTNSGVKVNNSIGGVGGISKTGTGTLTLAGNNTYTGTTTVTAGILQLAASERINNSANLTLNGGTFNTAGFSETMNKLALTAASTIDLGAGASVVHFNNSSIPSWTGAPAINNWTGSQTGGGTDQIFVGSNNYSGLTHDQLNSIQFAGQGSGAILLSSGELVPNLSGTPLSTIVRGDFDQNQVVNGADITAMLKALANVPAYEATKQLSDGDVLNVGDFDNSGTFTNGDIQGLLDLVAAQPGGGSLAAVPEPSAFVLGILGLIAIPTLRHRRGSRRQHD